MLAEEGLWGHFAFLRAIADVPAHTALVRVLTNSIVTKNPLIQHAIFTAIEKEIAAVSESPEENFKQIQKSSEVNVLTTEIVAKVAKELVNVDLVRGLELAAREHPKLLTDPRLRTVLGRTDRVAELGRIGLKNTSHPDFKKLMVAVEKSSSTGRDQTVSDNIDRFLKKVDA
jgi:hypothetical protein